jgi:hypothetical protein
MMLTETQMLARELDRLLASTSRRYWSLLAEAAVPVLRDEWSGTVDGKPACPDCRRLQAYGSHPCSCPTGKVRKRLGPLVCVYGEAA